LEREYHVKLNNGKPANPGKKKEKTSVRKESNSSIETYNSLAEYVSDEEKDEDDSFLLDSIKEEHIEEEVKPVKVEKIEE